MAGTVAPVALLALLVAFLGLMGGGHPGAHAAPSAFLSSQLPLKPILTTPIEILKARAGVTVKMYGRQAIQVGGPAAGVPVLLCGCPRALGLVHGTCPSNGFVYFGGGGRL
jgi:hypothetical protein